MGINLAVVAIVAILIVPINKVILIVIASSVLNSLVFVKCCCKQFA